MPHVATRLKMCGGCEALRCAGTEHSAADTARTQQRCRVGHCYVVAWLRVWIAYVSEACGGSSREQWGFPRHSAKWTSQLQFVSEWH